MHRRPSELLDRNSSRSRALWLAVRLLWLALASFPHDAAAQHASAADTSKVFAATLHIVGPDTAGKGATCSIGPAKAPPQIDTAAVLSISLLQTADAAKSSMSPVDYDVYVGGSLKAPLLKGKSDTTTTLSMNEYAGRTVEVRAHSDSSIVCATYVPSQFPPVSLGLHADKSFLLSVGAEFSSADGFKSQTLRAPVAASWTVNFGAQPDGLHVFNMRWFPQYATRVVMTTMGEITSTSSWPTQFTVCSPGASGDSIAPLPAPPAASCRPRSFANHTFTDYATRSDTIRADTTGASSVPTVRLTSLLRLEFGSNKDGHVVSGPAAWMGFQTNPAGSLHSIGTIHAFGWSIRQLAHADSTTKFDLVVLYGAIESFPITVHKVYVNPQPTSPVDSVRDVTVPAAPVLLHGLIVRLQISPLDGYTIRGYAQYNSDPSKPTLATIAILKSLDLGQVFKNLGL